MTRQFIYILTVIFMFATAPVVAQNDDAFYNRLESLGYEIIDIENDGLMKFLDDRSYENPKLTSNYSYSVVKKYSKGVSSKPAGLLLRWNSPTPAEEISSVVVTLVESATERDASLIDGDLSGERVRYYFPDITKKEYLLCNMCPRRYFYYKIEEVSLSGQRSVLKKGMFYTDGQIRMLRVDGMVNVRDFGGWDTSFGRNVVYGRIFRGNRPAGITATGKNDFVKNEHITADLDLQGKDLGVSPMGPLDEVEYYCTNNARYKSALVGRTEILAKDLDIIASVLSRGGSVFLHCYHGMNRAGTLSFIIDGLLGLSEGDISKEYELSSFAYGNARNATYGAMLPVIRSYDKDGDDLAQCFYNFALSIGVSEANLDIIRCTMLGLSADDELILKAHRR